MAGALAQLELNDGIALLRLNRPPLNPLSTALLDEIAAHATMLAADAAVKAVVVTGNEKALAAGADISEFTEPGAAPRVTAAFRGAFDALGVDSPSRDRGHRRLRARRWLRARARVRPACRR